MNKQQLIPLARILVNRVHEEQVKDTAKDFLNEITLILTESGNTEGVKDVIKEIENQAFERTLRVLETYSGVSFQDCLPKEQVKKYLKYRD